MKVAVASSDGTNISPHFGRSSHFLIFNIEEGKIAGKEVRNNTFTAHGRGQCGSEQHGGHGMHDHASVVEALSDCQAVLCYGMGRRAAEALAGGGIQVFMLGEECTPERAVSLYLEGKLAPAGDELCRGRS
jgi:predicted Fe-Mo cluster-binding NifX family protein